MVMVMMVMVMTVMMVMLVGIMLMARLLATLINSAIADFAQIFFIIFLFQECVGNKNSWRHPF